MTDALCRFNLSYNPVRTFMVLAILASNLNARFFSDLLILNNNGAFCTFCALVRRPADSNDSVVRGILNHVSLNNNI